MRLLFKFSNKSWNTGVIRGFFEFAYFAHLLQVPFAEIGAKVLTFAIYDFDRFSKHDQIGQVKVPLNSVDLGRVVEEWRDLTSPESDSEKVRAQYLFAI